MSLILTHGWLWQGLLELPTPHPTLDAEPLGERLFDIVWAPAHSQVWTTLILSKPWAKDGFNIMQ